MEMYLLLVVFAALVTTATEPLKNLWDHFVLLKTGAMEWHDISVGAFLPLLFSFPIIFGLGYGIVGIVMGFEYTSDMLWYTDLVVTSFIVSLGANKIFDLAQDIVNKFQ